MRLITTWLECLPVKTETQKSYKWGRKKNHRYCRLHIHLSSPYGTYMRAMYDTAYHATPPASTPRHPLAKSNRPKIIYTYMIQFVQLIVPTAFFKPFHSTTAVAYFQKKKTLFAVIYRTSVHFTWLYIRWFQTVVIKLWTSYLREIRGYDNNNVLTLWNLTANQFHPVLIYTL